MSEERGWWEAGGGPEVDTSTEEEPEPIFPPDSLEGYSSTDDEEENWIKSLGYFIGFIILMVEFSGFVDFFL
ncbi:MAG: hypothetical protein QF911_07275 [Candidatus Thalassarchaeaceae archaeon]|jgi:hypothetical protein|nr:hypothetical protein [Candidatus Thalassarchaeaceae archaeon]